MLKNLDTFFELLKLHGTPGDETEVRNYLERGFTAAGWETDLLGPYAITACSKHFNRQRPTVLICAHMDSPGFAVDAIVNGQLRLIPFGGVQPGASFTGILKTTSAKYTVKVTADEDEESDHYWCPKVGDAQAGDRVCYKAEPLMDQDGLIQSPYIDNRAGCALLLELAELMDDEQGPVNYVFAATAMEEVNGFGANVLARQVNPDFVICLDATYEALDQNVKLGHGPVVTHSDRSVIMSLKLRDRLEELFYDFGVHYQTEVYNYSGTDAKSFPMQGLPCVAIPLLLPSRGNHTPVESCDLIDLLALRDATKILAERAWEYELIMENRWPNR